MARYPLSAVLFLAIAVPQVRGQCMQWNSVYPLMGGGIQPLSAAYHPVRQRVFVYTQSLGGLWSWDGAPSSWIAESYANTTTFSHPDGMIYDDARDRLVMHGSTDFGPQTWEWDGSSWTQGPGGPTTQYGRLVFDSDRNVAVLLGYNPSTDAFEIAEYDGTTWTNVTPTGASPSLRWYSSAAYDSQRHKIVLFGGYLLPFPSYTGLGDTWEYDPASQSWTQVSTSGPQARWCASMEYDSVRGVCVLYGGVYQAPTGPALNDTWEWDGDSWSNITPSNNYTETKYYAPMAFAAHRGVMYLCGGQTVYGNLQWRLSDTAYEFGIDSDCNGTIDAYETRTVTQWRSLRTHSGDGELGIVLNAAATGNGATGPTVETRGVNANAGVRKIAVDFSGPVALLDPAQISVTYWTTIDPSTISAAQTLTPSNVQMTGPQTLTLDVVGAPAEACFNIVLQPGLTTATITGDSDCMLRSLSGDANMDGIVDSADLDITRDRIGDSVIAYPELDFTLSAGINIADMSYCKSRFTHLVLCPTP